MTSDAYIGRIVGNYRLLAQIGGGAFGNVYRAEHIHLGNRFVAVKVMHTAHLDSEEDRERFLKEARLLAQLKHPHILPLLDVGLSEGFPYLVTEFAVNGSLRDRIRKQHPTRIPPAEALTILSQVGEAISMAHKHNVIHRDIKPANILFNDKRDVLLADFGIATTLASASIKNINEMTGSAPYMAPEQFQGKISKECDQYALGCIAYELFTGHQPFHAPDFVSMAFKHLTEPPSALREFTPSIPPHVEQAVLRALSKERTQRFPDVLDFIAALRSPNASQLPREDSSTLLVIPPPIEEPSSSVVLDTQAVTYAPVSPAQTNETENAAYATIIAPPTLITPTPITGPIISSPPTIPDPITPLPIADDAATVRKQPSSPATPIPDVIMPPPLEFTAVDGQVPFSQPPASRPQRRQRLLFLIAAILAIALLLIPAGVAAFYTFDYPAIATISLHPIYKDLKTTFTINGVTGKADSTKNQVVATRILTTTKKKVIPVSATGNVNTPSQQAYGVVTITNHYPYSVTYDAGSGYINNGYTVLLSQSITLSANATATVGAYVSSPIGAASNMRAHTIDGSYCTSFDPNCSQGYQTAVNNNGFFGGQNAGSYTVVQQSDIDQTATPAKKSLLLDAQKDLRKLINANEQLIGNPQCPSQVSSDQNAGDSATNFNVTVVITCTGIAYDTKPAQNMAADLLKAQASTSFGPHFSLFGTIITTTAAAKITDIKKGIVSQALTAEGIWQYTFTKAEEQLLAQFISGKTAADARNLLLHQDGIDNVQISLSGTFWIWDKLPTNLDHILFTRDEKDVPKLQVTPTVPAQVGPGTGAKPLGTGTPSITATPTKHP